MQEDELRRYFLGQRSACELAADILGSVVQLDRVRAVVRIVDMQEPFALERHHLVSLCDAFNQGALGPEALSTIAFALMASDTFAWEDEVTSEVLSDWSAPEINYELNAETIAMHRGWLLGSSKPPSRACVQIAGTPENLVSMRTKQPS